jgi:recombination protein RecA
MSKVKQPAKPKFDLDAYKKKIKVADTPLKKDKFVELDECMHEILGMPGLPLGHITEIYGKSDTGKTSIMFHAAAQAQAQGILPIIIVTEGKVSWDRASSMGLNPEGFVLIREDLQYLEEVYSFMGKICADVGTGELPHDVMIFWDSLGNTLSRKEVEEHSDGTVERKSTMMVAGKANSEGLRVLSTQVNNTRKVSYPKTVGITIINTCYTKPPAFPGGMSSEVPYGGEAAWYKASLILRTKRKKKLTASKDGVVMGFGIVSAISVEKNHITNTSHSGEYVITGNAIIPNEKSAIDNYKESNKEHWGALEIYDEDSGEVFDSKEITE